MEEFVPQVVGFFCNWCAYTGADLAGSSRLKYPPNIKIIRVMCSGSVSPLYIVRALALGADGVLVAGCHPGDCHYERGNLLARRRVNELWKMLDAIGIDRRRVRLEWISASEGVKVPQVVNEFVETLKKLGPNPLKKGGVSDAGV